jgi:hypothetical protein
MSFLNIDFKEVLYSLLKNIRYIIAILFLKYFIFLKDIKKDIKHKKIINNKFYFLLILSVIIIISLIDYLVSILLFSILLLHYNIYN